MSLINILKNKVMVIDADDCDVIKIIIIINNFKFQTTIRPGNIRRDIWSSVTLFISPTAVHFALHFALYYVK
jgi:hypothetical protein